MNRRATGFTLIELAIVTAIIGLLAAGAVTSFGALRTNTKIKETTRALKATELALQSFIARNGRLPCPADPTLGPADAGYASEALLIIGPTQLCAEARRIGVSAAYWGSVPAMTLGIPPRDLTDGWDHQFFYVVVGSAARPAAVTNRLWTLDDNVANEIELADLPNGTAGRQVIVNQGVAALISAGANGSGAYTLEGARLDAPVGTAVSELDNQDADIYLVTTDYSEDDATPFDDIVRVYTEDDLLMPLAELGEVQTKAALTATRMQRIVNAIYGYAATQSGSPDGGATRTWARTLPQADSNSDGTMDTVNPDDFPFLMVGTALTDVQDAWGNPFVYDPDDQASSTAVDGDAGLYGSSTIGLNNPVFTLTSGGPDFNLATAADNIVVRHTLQEALGRLTGAGIPVDP